MQTAIADTFANIHQSLLWLPKWVPGVLLLLVVTLLAIALYNTVLRLLLRFSPRSVFLQKLLGRTHAPNRAALIIIALGFVLPATGFPFAVMGLIGHVLATAIILLVGWDALIATVIGSEFYLRRFPIEAEDNLFARKQVTQVIMLRRAANTLIVIVAVTAALMTFPVVRRYGIDFLVSAGAAGIIVGLAARPLLANLVAGVQIAITQPFRIDDAVVIQGEWGRIERIAGTYVVVNIWDGRRLIVPLSHFIEHPFQNLTYKSAALIGSVHLSLDYTVPVEHIRAKATEIVEASQLWDGRVVNVQVVNSTERAIQLRVLASARNSPDAWDLRCQVREKLIGFLQSEYPNALPKFRAEFPSQTPLARTGRANPEPPDAFPSPA